MKIVSLGFGLRISTRPSCTTVLKRPPRVVGSFRCGSWRIDESSFEDTPNDWEEIISVCRGAKFEMLEYPYAIQYFEANSRRSTTPFNSLGNWHHVRSIQASCQRLDNLLFQRRGSLEVMKTNFRALRLPRRTMCFCWRDGNDWSRLSGDLRSGIFSNLFDLMCHPFTVSFPIPDWDSYCFQGVIILQSRFRIRGSE